MSASEEPSQGPVIRDRRRIDPVTGKPREAGAPAGPGQAGTTQPGAAQLGAGQPRPGKHAASKPGGIRTEAAETGGAAEAAEAAGAAGAADNGKAGQGEAGMTGTGAPGQEGPGKPKPPGDGSAASRAAQAPNLDVALMLAERTADLQRLQAEYVNYRKRVERDRAAVREQSLASVLAELLPVLDDIGRAREHGELTGGFKSVAESLEAAVTKLGLTTYGEVGEEFDPNIHEALMHAYSPDVTETTCVQILQPGYKVGERILRPARVAVAEPSDPAGARTTSGEAAPDSEAAPDGDTGADGQAGSTSEKEPGDRPQDDTE